MVRESLEVVEIAQLDVQSTSAGKDSSTAGLRQLRIDVLTIVQDDVQTGPTCHNSWILVPFADIPNQDKITNSPQIQLR